MGNYEIPYKNLHIKHASHIKYSAKVTDDKKDCKKKLQQNDLVGNYDNRFLKWVTTGPVQSAV